MQDDDVAGKNDVATIGRSPTMQPRLRQFLDAIERPAWQRAWAGHLAAAVDPITLRQIGSDLACLPDPAWNALLADILRQIDRRRPATGWPQACDRFHESRAYRYLEERGCRDIVFAAPGAAARSPDLFARREDSLVACEVKTLHLAAAATTSGLRRKLAERCADARAQLHATRADERILYLVARGPGTSMIGGLVEAGDYPDLVIVLDRGDSHREHGEMRGNCPVPGR
jgi:hypothetical protein